MDIEKLIDTLKQHGVSCVRSYGKYCSICDEAATALSTLQAENEKLRAELEQARTDCAVAEKNHADCIDELEQVKQEKDAAVKAAQGLDKIVGRAWGEED